MGILLIGLAIAMLDFPLLLSGGKALDLTPDVLGYILIIYGIRQIGRLSPKFIGAYKLTHFAAIAAGAVFGTNLLIGQDYMSMVTVLLGIAEMILQIVLLIFFAAGFADMEKDLGIRMHSKWLKLIAIGIAAGTVLGYAGIVVPGLEKAGSLMVDVLHFAYLILFYFAWESYKATALEEEE